MCSKWLGNVELGSKPLKVMLKFPFMAAVCCATGVRLTMARLTMKSELDDGQG